MKKYNRVLLIFLYAFILISTFLAAIGGSKIATVFRENTPIASRKCVVIDAGHGGIDGGTTSCTGVLESKINLDIAIKLNDMMHLLGIKTVMIRDSDRSIHTKGGTIAAQKMSDLKERVRIASETQNGILVSIHQNYFTSSAYSGAQIFYKDDEESKSLAQLLQRNFSQTLNPGNKRKTKQARGIYLMEHVSCPAVLVECGFLSNPSEEAKLTDPKYQLAVSVLIASSCSEYLFANANRCA